MVLLRFQGCGAGRTRRETAAATLGDGDDNCFVLFVSMVVSLVPSLVGGGGASGGGGRV